MDTRAAPRFAGSANYYLVWMSLTCLKSYDLIFCNPFWRKKYKASNYFQQTSYIRHKDFRPPPPPPSGLYYPPEIWNGLDCRALVKSHPPNIGKLREQHFFLAKKIFLQKNSLLKKSDFKCFSRFWEFLTFIFCFIFCCCLFFLFCVFFLLFC